MDSSFLASSKLAFWATPILCTYIHQEMTPHSLSNASLSSCWTYQEQHMWKGCSGANVVHLKFIKNQCRSFKNGCAFVYMPLLPSGNSSLQFYWFAIHVDLPLHSHCDITSFDLYLAFFFCCQIQHYLRVLFTSIQICIWKLLTIRTFSLNGHTQFLDFSVHTIKTILSLNASRHVDLSGSKSWPGRCCHAGCEGLIVYSPMHLAWPRAQMNRSHKVC